jgi:hypothetical protein
VGVLKVDIGDDSGNAMVPGDGIAPPADANDDGVKGFVAENNGALGSIADAL